MTAWRVPLTQLELTEDDLEAVTATLRSGWLSMGPRVAEFEQALAEFTGAPHVVAMANGSAALLAMLATLDLEPGDEVVVPSLTFCGAVSAVVHAGGTPVFADVGALSQPWIDAATVEPALTDRTRAVLSTTYGGHPGGVGGLEALCGERGIALVEDAAHGLGSRAGERHVGTVGRAGALSFFSNKNLAIGEGGAVLTADAQLADRVRLLRSNGMTSDTWARHHASSGAYSVEAVGYNLRIDEPRAALGTSRLQRISEENARRGEIAQSYRAALAELPVVLPDPIADTDTSSHHLFTLALPEDADRDAVRRALAEAGVQTTVHYPPAHLQPAFAPWQRDALANTEALGERGLTLPLHPFLDDAAIRLVVDSLKDAL